MAKPARSSSSLRSDDPIENFNMWLQSNGKAIGVGVAVVAAVGLGIFGVRASDAKKNTNASAALYSAQAPLHEGNIDAAKVALADVVSRYKGTSPGDQAALLLAQAHYDAGDYQAGIDLLTDISSSVSKAFKPAVELLLAGGQEGLNNFEAAASHYEKAANMAALDVERNGHKLSQARALMIAGKRVEAIALFKELEAIEGSPYAQEASVRLGELEAAGGV